MKEIDFQDIKNIGAEIVCELIHSNIKKFQPANINFQIIDLLEVEIPDFDFIFCRDCFVHFSFKDIFKL